MRLLSEEEIYIEMSITREGQLLLPTAVLKLENLKFFDTHFYMNTTLQLRLRRRGGNNVGRTLYNTYYSRLSHDAAL